jgi:cyclohexyl-isocyanide hydratase
MTTSPSQQHAPPQLQIGMLLFPGMTLLDLIGPQTALAFHGKTHLLWKTRNPVTTDSGVAILPTASFAECPEELDVLFAPGGGAAVGDVMEDDETLAFLAERGKNAGHVASVCTGSLILGAAGLLDGYKAATHWAAYEALEALGVEGVRERVVADGNRLTGGGITAGIDFGLTLLARLRGETAARVAQLVMEYDPKPPFDSGTPEKAAPEITAIVRRSLQEQNILDRWMEGAKAARRKRAEAI